MALNMLRSSGPFGSVMRTQVVPFQWSMSGRHGPGSLRLSPTAKQLFAVTHDTALKVLVSVLGLSDERMIDHLGTAPAAPLAPLITPATDSASATTTVTTRYDGSPCMDEYTPDGLNRF